MEELIVFLKENYQISLDEIEKLRNVVCSFSYRKGEVLLSEGNISSKIYFISDGIMRTYYTDYDKKDIIEFTRRIYFKNDFCCNWESFRHQQKSKEYIECIEDAKGVYIEYSTFNRLLEESFAFKSVYISILEKFQDYHLKKHNFINHLSLIDRIKNIEKYYPKMRQKVSNKILASFLYTSPQHLCYIKRKIIQAEKN